MTVAELITILQLENPTAQVMVWASGYGTGSLEVKTGDGADDWRELWEPALDEA